ncbi:hypothetical protein [Ferrimonas pelagia]|uniref:PH domain-containing protein n=1 Tax=Ferrimonas pelagia TaxID=1177826 RepID=A0ABP9F683_9GAMM
MSYRHRQPGYLIVAVLGLAIAAIAFKVPSSTGLAGAVIAFLALVLLLFSSLTVTLTSTSLTWHFSFGFWTKRLALSEIVQVETRQTPWWYGWGIRLTPHGWLYNVSGRHAVKLHLKDGRTLLLGTDQPEQLQRRLQQGLTHHT